MSSEKLEDLKHLDHPSEEDVPKLNVDVPAHSELATVLAKEKPGQCNHTVPFLTLISSLKNHGREA